MAQEVADTLGVELELVAVQSSNRMQFLEQGKIDPMIATMSDRKDRRDYTAQHSCADHTQREKSGCQTMKQLAALGANLRGGFFMAGWAVSVFKVTCNPLTRIAGR